VSEAAGEGGSPSLPRLARSSPMRRSVHHPAVAEQVRVAILLACTQAAFQESETSFFQPLNQSPCDEYPPGRLVS
jgi:hypothetical protein